MMFGHLLKKIPLKPLEEKLCQATAHALLDCSCNHIAALLFRIESAVTTGVTNPSKTSLCCEWVIPSGIKIDMTPTKAEELFFSNSKYTSNKDKYDKQKHSKQKFANYKPSSYKKHNAEVKNEVELRNSLFKSLKPDIQGSSISEMIMGKRSINTKTKKYVLPPPLPALVQNISSVVPINDIYNIILTKYECIPIEKNTKNQSVNPIWHEQRRGRLTASNQRKSSVAKKTDSLIIDVVYVSNH